MRTTSTRRILGLCVALAVAAAACGSDSSADDAAPADTAGSEEAGEDAAVADDVVEESVDETVAEEAATDEAATSEETAGDAAPDAGFPLTIVHKFGETTVDAEPERVVSVGYNEHDFLLSIGVVPVGLREWYGEQPYSTWPWAQEALGDATPSQVADTEGLNYEAIAAMDPDIIVGIWSGMTAEEYELLSAIAPTIAQSDEYVDYGTPWQEQTRTLGLVTGHTEEAEAAVARVEAKLQETRAAHPEWSDKTAAVAFLFEEQPGAYNSEDPRSRFLTDLGFSIPEKFDDSAEDSFFFEMSAETMPEQLDVDVVVWIGGSNDELEQIVGALPTRAALPAFLSGGEVFAGELLTGAFSHSSPLSLEYVIDTLAPELALAADGDPSTMVPSAEEFGTVVGG